VPEIWLQPLEATHEPFKYRAATAMYFYGYFRDRKALTVAKNKDLQLLGSWDIPVFIEEGEDLRKRVRGFRFRHGNFRRRETFYASREVNVLGTAPPLTHQLIDELTSLIVVLTRSTITATTDIR